MRERCRRYQKPANYKENRRDRRRAKTKNGKRKAVVRPCASMDRGPV
jgi:hypothetical protein